MYKVIVVVGPTAVGKSDLAIELAKKFHGEIINGDSIQVYKELNIGSAKVTTDEMQGIPHHLLDYKEVSEDYNVAVFQKDARSKIEEISQRGNIPIVCGGTGLYIKALLYDYSFVQMEANHSGYEEFTNEQLYNKLVLLDKDSAEKIHPNNRKRVIRALQMAESGNLKSQQEAAQQHTMIYDTKIIGLTMDRDKLKQRIDMRVDKMVNNGLIEEIKNLFGHYPLGSHGFQGIGYKEFIPYYENKETLQDCIEQVKVHTRQFAKKQYTWFNHQMQVDWYDIEQQNYRQNIMNDVQKFIEK